MDVKVTWKVNSDVETLIAAIVKCKQDLTMACFSKHGMKSRALTCDVYASSKLLELLQLHDRWSPYLELLEEDLLTPVWRRQKKTTEQVATFGTDFNIHRMELLGEESIRVLATFETPDNSAAQTWYANVEIIK